jgi:hypothetical protein
LLSLSLSFTPHMLLYLAQEISLLCFSSG